MDMWATIDDYRSALYEDLAGLDEAQWDVQSLCTEWKVRHVVAHVSDTNFKVGHLLGGVLKNGMNLNRFAAREALATGAAPPEVLLARLKDTIGSRAVPPMAKPVTMLTDIVCHSGDIRRPLGISRSASPEALMAVADYLRGGIALGAKKRTAGVRLSATDADWSVGDGPAVEGPLESLVLVMAGRSQPMEDLSGEGVSTLRSGT